MALDVVVPGLDVGVPDGPVDGDAVLGIPLEIEVSQPIALASPPERASADLVAAEPVEPPDLGVRAVLVGCPEGEILLVEWIVALQDGIHLFHRLGTPATMRVLPRRLGGVHVVLHVLHTSTALQHDDAQSFFRELLGGPSAGDSRADDDGVELRSLSLHAGEYAMLQSIRNTPLSAYSRVGR